MGFPSSLHILTYDLHGTIAATGQDKPTRHTGLVAHTHHLLTALAAQHPDTRWAITHTGATDADRTLGAYQLRTPDGITVLAQGIATHFPQLLDGDGGKDPERVQHFYETTIDDPDNPVYASLARAYTHAIAAAGTPNLVAQNVNPLVSVLKACESGRLRAAGIDRVNVTGVVHDLAGAPKRFDYVRRHLLDTGPHSVQLVAVSPAVAEHLTAAGIPADRIHMVPNGMDVDEFTARVRAAARADSFAAVAARNQLPSGRMVLLSARRVAWKGHADLIEAMRTLANDNRFADVFVAMNGHDMHDTRALDYTRHLEELIAAHGLERKVFLLDELSQLEVAACYHAAEVAVLPSGEPEAWGYSNLEAMLAGTPVIATAHGGPLAYLEHERSGMLVPPRDPAALAGALSRLLTDPALHSRLVRQGRVSAARFDVAAMAAGYAGIIAAHPQAVRA